MKTLAFIFLLSSQAMAEESAWERATYVLGASMVYVAYDYFVFYPNQWRGGTTEEIAFRISQVALLGALTWFLVDKFGWKTGAAFGALYLSWNFDAAYYAIAGRGSWDEVRRGKVTWARHTPAGLFESPTSERTLKIQLGIGAIVSIAFIL